MITRKLNNLRSIFVEERKKMLGLPGNLDFSFSALFPFFDFLLNNVGDPFVDSNYKLHTKELERELLAFYAQKYKMHKHYWGYVTNGGTESNMYGLLMGRDLLQRPLLYFSQDTHYSIRKIASILNLGYVVVPSQENGEIDYNSLEKLLLKHKKFEPILNLNIGTTFKGAIDSVQTVVSLLKKHSFISYYIHCDAALFGGYLPFLAKSLHIDFSLPINSLAISGHKFIGCPMACGIFLTNSKDNKLSANREIEYISTTDTTISGSRNGHSVLMLWYRIMTKGVKGYKKDTAQCLKNARYLLELLHKNNIEAYRNHDSNIVYFSKPSQKVCNKWQLSTQGSYAHVVVMPHVSKRAINDLIQDLKF